MTEQLKPCPFCGGENVDLWPMDGWESPVCLDCGATIVETIATGEDTCKQIAAWNNRVKESDV